MTSEELKKFQLQFVLDKLDDSVNKRRPIMPEAAQVLASWVRLAMGVPVIDDSILPLRGEEALAWLSRMRILCTEGIDTSDIPELTEEFFKSAKVRLPKSLSDCKDCLDGAPWPCGKHREMNPE